jgi:hypothetical protein
MKNSKEVNIKEPVIKVKKKESRWVALDIVGSSVISY